ncbi:MAG TPA: hypothetical protein VFT10_08220 [Solirubrobacterales bacterium]|nr:hypothetical protein [Solirubrobacterales bacterium]
MYRMRERWTDERFDDFAKHVDQRFDAADQRFDAVERRMKDGFDRVDADMRELRRDMTTKFDGLQRTLLLSNAAIIAGLIGVIATQV